LIRAEWRVQGHAEFQPHTRGVSGQQWRARPEFFYRRFYLKDGDGATLTRAGRLPAVVIKRDPVSDGNAGRLTDRLYFTPAIGFGARFLFWRTPAQPGGLAPQRIQAGSEPRFL